MRDEMANLAWAIERAIEGPLERALRRGDPALPEPATPALAAEPDLGVPRYSLASTVPEHWIPLLPVQLAGPGGTVLTRLARGAVLVPDGSMRVHRARGLLLNLEPRLQIHDEEVPREGARLSRHYELARWIDGSTHCWIGIRKAVGRGEGSSGLRFDRPEPPAGSEPPL